MAKIKPRVKVPKKAAAGDMVTIKSLISHPMETGLRKDKKTGDLIPRRIINTFTASFNGKRLNSMCYQPSDTLTDLVTWRYRWQLGIGRWLYLFAQADYGANRGYLFLGMMPVATMVIASTVALVMVSLMTKPPTDSTLEKFFPTSKAA